MELPNLLSSSSRRSITLTMKQTLVYIGILIQMGFGSELHSQPVSTGSTNRIPIVQSPFSGGIMSLLPVKPTDAYNREVVRLMLPEVNQIVKDLHLSEPMPVTVTNITSVRPALPTAYLGAHVVGTLTTSNYVFYFTAGRMLSGFDQGHIERYVDLERRNYLWPISRKDTNAALQAAIEVMALVGADVKGLMHDCKVSIDATGESGSQFVPEYWIGWQQPKTNIAFMGYFAPTKTVRFLHVYDPRYLLRPSIEITNLVEVLTPENPRDAVLEVVERSTNVAKMREYLMRKHAPEDFIKKAETDWTNKNQRRLQSSDYRKQ
jgi:hypothetical protein